MSDDTKCKWTLDDYHGRWVSGCSGDDGFCFNEGGPADNRFVYCPFCGKPIEEIEFEGD